MKLTTTAGYFYEDGKRRQRRRVDVEIRLDGDPLEFAITHTEGDCRKDGEWITVMDNEEPRRWEGGSGKSTAEALERISEAAAPWTGERLLRLAEIARCWHLNGLNAGCEHQRAEGWDKRPIDPDKPLDSYGVHYPGQTQPSWNMLTWVRPSEYPDGLLGAPCATCGYKFGTAWLHESLPDEVIRFIHEVEENVCA